MLNSADILIADLESKFEQIEKGEGDKSFYTKVADYGKYLLGHKTIHEVLTPLYEEAQQDIQKYLKAAKEFLDQWNVLAKNLIIIAQKAGIKDHLQDPFDQNTAKIKSKLGQINISAYNKDIEDYFLPYQLLINRFFKEGKQNFIIPKHIEKDNNYCRLQISYNNASQEWNKFKQMRNIKTWWAHYQIERFTYGALDLKEGNKYFKSDNTIDQWYKFEFSQILGNQSSTFILLNRKKFENWITILHKYLIPRLKSKKDSVDQRKRTHQLSGQFKYFPNSNVALFKGNDYTFIGKSKALLDCLFNNIRTPLSLKEIQEKCNPSLSENKKFRSDKDLSDTLRYVKRMLNVRKGEYFPIQKEANTIIWIDR